jgi:hypothetical protein
MPLIGRDKENITFFEFLLLFTVSHCAIPFQYEDFMFPRMTV